MNFNEKIFEKVIPFFLNKGFIINDKSIDYLEIQNDKITMIFSYNKRERDLDTYIFKNNEPENGFELLNKILEEFFVTDIKLKMIPFNDYFDNVLKFFSGPGNPIINYDENIFAKLLEFVHNLNREYTKRNILASKIQRLDKAWKAKDYSLFITLIRDLDLEDLPRSYTEKLRIAKKRIE